MFECKVKLLKCLTLIFYITGSSFSAALNPARSMGVKVIVKDSRLLYTKNFSWLPFPNLILFLHFVKLPVDELSLQTCKVSMYVKLL